MAVTCLNILFCRRETRLQSKQLASNFNAQHISRGEFVCTPLDRSRDSLLVYLRDSRCLDLEIKGNAMANWLITCKKRAQWLQNGANTVACRPFLLQDVQTDVPMLIDIRMETWCSKFNSRCFKRIALWEPDIQLELQAFINCSCSSSNRPYPWEEIVTIWEGCAVLIVRHLQMQQLQ